MASNDVEAPAKGEAWSLERLGGGGLQDLRTGDTVSLEAVASAFREGRELRVVEAGSGEDVTALALMQVLSGKYIPSGSPPRILKHYGRGKLHDPEADRDLWPKEILDLLAQGQCVAVIDNFTRRDRTLEVLSDLLHDRLTTSAPTRRTVLTILSLVSFLGLAQIVFTWWLLSDGPSLGEPENGVILFGTILVVGFAIGLMLPALRGNYSREEMIKIGCGALIMAFGACPVVLVILALGVSVFEELQDLAPGEGEIGPGGIALLLGAVVVCAVLLFLGAKRLGKRGKRSQDEEE
jgi:hypothetical protein